MRRWNLRFSGDKADSVEQFLERLEEQRLTAGLSESEVLTSVSEVLVDTAAVWYCNNRYSWFTYQDFRRAAIRWYGVDERFRQRLQQEAAARTQGVDEPVRSYITKITAILNKLGDLYSETDKVALIFNNLHPRVKQKMNREVVRTMDDLLDQAIQAEALADDYKIYKPPAPPSASLCSQFAYKAPKAEKTATAVAAVQQADPAVEKQKKQIEKMSAQLESLKKSVAVRQSNGQQKAKKPGFFRGKSKGRQAANEPAADRAKQPPAEDKAVTTSDALKPKKVVICHNCGEPGHIKYKCPKKLVGGEPRKVVASPAQRKTTLNVVGPAGGDSIGPDTMARWWLRVKVAGADVRALYDPERRAQSWATWRCRLRPNATSRLPLPKQVQRWLMDARRESRVM